MALSILHAFVSSIPDDPAAVAAGEVVPSEWNAAHAISGTLDPTGGGTGLSSFSQGDIIFASAANTLSTLAKSTVATRYLANTGVNNSPAWDQINQRTILLVSTDYFVNNITGNDSNAGTLVAPWATLQHAVDYLGVNIDINTQTVTVHVADSGSTYPGVALRPFVGGGNLVFLGNNTALGNVKIGNSSQVGAVFSGEGLGGTYFWISGFEFVQTSGPALDFDGADRGTCILGEPTFLLSSKNKYSSCQGGGYVLVGNIFDNTLGTSVIDGNALDPHTPRAFYLTQNANTFGGFINCGNYSITGTVTFTQAFAVVPAGYATFVGTFPAPGTVHGSKFQIGANGTLFVDSITQLPGDLPGT